MSVTKVGIVIVTYNGAAYIDACLDSINEPSLDLEILVLDNHSNDSTLAKLKSRSSITIQVLKSNLGFGKANNLGIEMALSLGVEYVYLLNQDGQLTKGAIATLIDYQKKNINYGILSPMHYNLNGTLETNFNKWLQKHSNYQEANKRFSTIGLLDIQFVNAAHWLLTKDVIKTVGGFSPAFFVYGEDNNYVHRTLFNGYKIGVVKEVRAYHDTTNRPKNNKLKKPVNRFSISLKTILLNPNNSLKTGIKLATKTLLILMLNLAKSFKILALIKCVTIFIYFMSSINIFIKYRALELEKYYPHLHVRADHD